MSRKFSAVHEHCPPENYSPLAIRHSLLFYHSPVANCHSLPFHHQSLFAIRYSLPFFFADLPTCRFADKFWLGRSLALPQF
jgi:hypothetical protein